MHKGFFSVAGWVIFCMVIVSGCATTPMPQPAELVSPHPIQGNNGEYMCPYTSDGVLTEWVDKAVNAKIGATIGKTAGAFAGAKACEQIPIFGAFVGSAVGNKIGRSIAIKASGGWDYIKKTSDLSFNSLDNMSVYLYCNHSSHAHYSQALKATWEIYPAMKSRYNRAIRSAPRKTAY